MGYWTDHPMGGDAPMDLEGDLLSRYDSEYDEDHCYFEQPKEEIREKIEKDFLVLLKEAEEADNFTFPWILMNYGVQFPEEYLERVIELIGDGDGAERGYSPDEGPAIYCERLREAFRKGQRTITPDLECMGLFDTISLALESASLLPVNTI